MSASSSARRPFLVIDTGIGERNGHTVLVAARRLGGDLPLRPATTHVHPKHDLGAMASYRNSEDSEREPRLMRSMRSGQLLPNTSLIASVALVDSSSIIDAISVAVATRAAIRNAPITEIGSRQWRPR